MAHRYFVIGAGSIGRRHHRNLEGLGADVRLIPWREADLAALERELRGDTALIIATATPIRLDLVELAARTGTPFYVEKPLAFRVGDLDRLYAAADPVADRSVIGLMMRYHPAVLAQAEAGLNAYGFHFEIGHDVRQWRQNWRFGDSYAARAEGGGVLLDLCHEIDMAQCLFPGLTVTGVDCIGHRDFPGVDFATRIALARDGGPVGTVAMDYLSPRFNRRIGLRGRDEVVDLDLLTCREVRDKGQGPRERNWEFERNDMFLGLMRDFMALAEGRAPSGNPLLPRFREMYDSARLIAEAWEARVFRGMIKGGFS
jgi:predicted dehydrogenase